MKDNISKFIDEFRSTYFTTERIYDAYRDMKMSLRKLKEPFQREEELFDTKEFREGFFAGVELMMILFFDKNL